MSKCWYCNNELTSGDNPKHFGICNKCYDEMFKSGDTIIRSLTDKITELQKQLEEKEKEIRQLDNEKGMLLNNSMKLLKEKDEEIAYLTKQVRKFNNEAQKYFEDAYCNDFHNQDKISFAVERLEKVKEFVSRQLFITTKDCSDLDEAEAKGCNELREETIKEIDNQIKRLTHQHEDKGE